MISRRRGAAARRKSAGGKKRRKEEGRVSAAAKHPFVLTVVGALIAAWLVPAFAQQWQDRQRERELKRDIATQLDRESTSTVIAMRIVMDRRSPEAQTAAARLGDLQRSGLAGRERAQSALLAAKERERDARARTYLDVLSSWLVNRSVIRSTLDAQFSNEELSKAWASFANQVTYYVRLAAAAKIAERRFWLGKLTDYLGGPPDGVSWALLARPPDRVAVRGRLAYELASGTLANELLLRKTRLVEGLLQAHAAGYSTTTKDLIKDLLPFVG